MDKLQATPDEFGLKRILELTLRECDNLVIDLESDLIAARAALKACAEEIQWWMAEHRCCRKHGERVLTTHAQEIGKAQ